MSIVTGIATAPGVSPLLNAPRETNPDQRPNQLTQAGQTGGTGREPGRTVANATTARPVIGIARGSALAEAEDTRTSSDTRYMRFVRALEIVRTDPGLEILDDQRLADIREEVDSDYLIEDGIPGEVEPLPPEGTVLIEPLVDLERSAVLDLDAVGDADDPADLIATDPAIAEEAFEDPRARLADGIDHSDTETPGNPNSRQEQDDGPTLIADIDKQASRSEAVSDQERGESQTLGAQNEPEEPPSDTDT